jgi:hypothetical protein
MCLVEERITQGSIKATNFPSTSPGMVLEQNSKVYVRLTVFTKDFRELVLPEQLRYSRV